MKRWKKIGLLSGLGISIFAFAAYWTYELSDAHAQREQYAVYSDYLSDELLANYHDFGSGKGLLVILDHSVRPLTSHSFPQASEGMNTKLLVDSLRTITFERRFTLPMPYKLVSSDKFDEHTGYLADLSPVEAQQSFGGYITLSRVSFNRTATLAMFYTEHLACGLCGGGNLVLMRKEFGHWKVIDDYSPWVS